MKKLDTMQLRAAISSQQMLFSSLITESLDGNFSKNHLVKQMFIMDQKIYNDFGVTPDQYNSVYAMLLDGMTVEDVKILLKQKV